VTFKQLILACVGVLWIVISAIASLALLFTFPLLWLLLMGLGGLVWLTRWAMSPGDK
jgi:hypothetical protein